MKALLTVGALILAPFAVGILLELMPYFLAKYRTWRDRVRYDWMRDM
jgi:hypothetical protein